MVVDNLVKILPVIKALYSPELIVNGTFDDSVSPWVSTGSVSLSWGYGKCTLSQTSAYSSGYQNVDVKTGDSYKVSALIDTGNISGYIQIRDKSSNEILGELRSDCYSEVIITALSSSIVVKLHGGNVAVGSCSFDNISVRRCIA